MKKTSAVLQEHAKNGQYALAHHAHRPLNCVQDKDAVVDLIADLLHFCASRKFDCKEVLDASMKAFCTQRAEELGIWK